MRDELLDISRGSLIFLVVLGHGIQYTLYSNTDFWEDPIFKLIYMFHMPVFVYISGYLAPFDSKFSLRVLFNRLSRLLLPLLCWMLLYIGLKSFFITHDLPSFYMFISIISSSLWYLWVLGAVTIIFFIVQIGTRIAGIIIFIFSWLVIWSLHGVWFFSEILYLLPFFVLGAASARLKLHLKIATTSKLFWFPVIAICAALYENYDSTIYIYTSKHIPFDFYSYAYRMLSGVFIGTLFVGLCFWLHTNQSKLGKMLGGLGKHTLSIYVLSSFIQPKMLGLINYNPLVNTIFILILSLVLTLLFNYISGFLRQFVVTRRLLLGER